MTHAWLIIAHNEFEILQLLVSALDDVRNDLYVHIDKKVKTLPRLSVQKSRLFLLENRMDVRWGAPSQISCELLLMRTALKSGQYDRFHIISGTHLPLKSRDQLTAFFDRYDGCELMHVWEKDERDIGNKLQRYNLFVNGFSSPAPGLQKFSRFCWTVAQGLQKRLRINRFPGKAFIKSDNWVSLTRQATEYLVGHAADIVRKYRFSYCGDEYFVATELNKAGGFHIVNTEQLLKVDFVLHNPRVYTMDDYEALASSDCLFARKFSSSHMDIAQRIIQDAQQ